MKITLLFFGLALGSASAGLFTNSPDSDAFVRANAPTANYGGAGSVSVSGSSATNVSGLANGLFDTFLRFNTMPTVTNFNAKFGSNNWAINGISLAVTEMATPANALFDRGVGRFQIR